jgi:inosine-uridine nucleoside N-ribohydrolase
MHDPLCLAAAFRPDFLTWEEAYVDVELVGKLTFGETVGFFRVPGQPFPHTPNVLASVDVDVESFVQFYLERIRGVFA